MSRSSTIPSATASALSSLLKFRLESPPPPQPELTAPESGRWCEVTVGEEESVLLLAEQQQQQYLQQNRRALLLLPPLTRNRMRRERKIFEMKLSRVPTPTVVYYGICSKIRHTLLPLLPRRSVRVRRR